MSGIEGLLNYQCQILGRSSGPDVDVENQPVDHGNVVLDTVACAVQERSQAEQASLINIGRVLSTHKIYMVPPALVVDESLTLHVVELDRDLSIVGVRDGGGRGHHLEIDANEFDSGRDVPSSYGS
jgi:hypothetical protein